MIHEKMDLSPRIEQLTELYLAIRKHTESICKPLEIEDYVVQPIIDVSPPKWHLAHTTWFFETFILTKFYKGYQVFDPQYSFIFNSYYNNVGKRVARNNRGDLSRPRVKDIYAYRAHVDTAMKEFLLQSKDQDDWESILTLGLQHEQQHQELLWTDIKYILGTQPTYPPYSDSLPWQEDIIERGEQKFIDIEAGNYEVGFNREGFCFDNELDRHTVWVNDYSISDQLVTNGEYIEFIENGGYRDFNLWLDEGWSWINENGIDSPLYWEKEEGEWMNYTLKGFQKVNEKEALKHISFFEASAFALWKKMRLPTEMEWEIANEKFVWGKRWEITQSAYLPYPGFKIAPGAIGEYNGKFMVNQMTFRGSSVVTSPGHSRASYRNFFPPHLQWQFTGIRLVN